MRILKQCGLSADADVDADANTRYIFTLYRVGITASQLDLPSLTTLSEAGCGRLQLGATHWATSEA